MPWHGLAAPFSVPVLASAAYACRHMPSTAAGAAILVDDPRFSDHAPPAYHPERPERLVAARAAVASADVVWTPRAPTRASDESLVRVHSEAYLTELMKMSGKKGYIDPDTYVNESSVEVARLAAGSVAAMVNEMVNGPIARGVALVRPPGHHARREQAMGFCLLNNVAVAAAEARALGLPRVAIVDFDVHHGNGTQEMFYGDPSVLYVSTHQFPFYPGTGALDETGSGDGRGFTLNVPMTAGGGDSVYRGAFERVIVPVLDAFAPSIILISAGFDASLRDPLAEMTLSSPAFGWMSRALRILADKHSKGRIGLVLEGGYDLVALEGGLLSAIHGMVNGDAEEILREVDHDDLDRAEASARRAWSQAL
jgi:acetoin utilization deacetylase AcuC-like enzyme